MIGKLKVSIREVEFEKNGIISLFKSGNKNEGDALLRRRSKHQDAFYSYRFLTKKLKAID